MEVKLTYSEFLLYGQLGLMRRSKADLDGQKDRYGKPDRHLVAIDIESTLSEVAVAKYLGIYYHPHITPGNQDIEGVEVRSTDRPDGRLLLHDADKDDVPHVLVTGSQWTWELCGWILPRDGKKKEFWQADWGRPCYAVPQENLKPMELLKLEAPRG